MCKKGTKFKEIQSVIQLNPNVFYPKKSVIIHIFRYSGGTEISAGQLEVAIGQYNLKAPNVPTLNKVQRIHLHPEYKCAKFVSDIALLELEEDIEWSPNVGPACLPTESGYTMASTYSANEATAAGWGWMSEQQGIGKKKIYFTRYARRGLQKAVSPLLVNGKLLSCSYFHYEQKKKKNR